MMEEAGRRERLLYTIVRMASKVATCVAKHGIHGAQERVATLGHEIESVKPYHIKQHRVLD
jgi:hypothetical protein